MHIAPGSGPRVTSFSVPITKTTIGDQMKGTVPDAAWPAPAENESDPPGAAAAKRKQNTISRITLALLDEYCEERGRGYNPYDSNVARTGDVWKRKPKRD
jgi:hypothetical protein